MLYYLVGKKWKLAHVGCDRCLTWLQAYRRIEKFRTQKRGWIGNREFPVKKLKLVEVVSRCEIKTISDKTATKIFDI